MMTPLRLLIFGAHPDDGEFHAGGLATLFRRHGHLVKMVSLTNGEAGHHTHSAADLVPLRRAEAAAAAAVIGAESAVWNHRDGQLEPTLNLRWQVIRELRTYQPDLVLTHRTNDYHPDHRAVGHVVRDASYLVTVPAICRDVPALMRDPVVAYLPDRFTKPQPIAGDVVVDVEDCVPTVVAMLACHRSQVFEWLPYNQGILPEVPRTMAEQTAWLANWYESRLRPLADRYRAELIAQYGEQRGAEIKYAEIFEISEYAAPLTASERARLFGFLTQPS